MSDDQLVSKLQEWSSYLQLYTPLNPLDMVVEVFRSLSWYLIVGLANVQDATNGLAVKALTILNIANYKGFQDFVSKYQPLFIALSMLFILMTLIGMMVNRGKDTTLYDFFRNLLIGMIILIGFPWLWGQATSNTVEVASYVNQSSSMSTKIITQNLTDLDYVASKDSFDSSKFNGKGKDGDKAGLGLDSTKNFLTADKDGNIKVSELNKIDPTETIDSDHSQVSLSDDDKKILTSKLAYGTDSAKAVDLAGGFFGFGAEHYFRYHWNFFRIAFYQILGILVSLILTFKVAQIGYEIWYNGAFIQGAALMDTRTGKRLLAMGQKFFVSLGAVIVIFVMQTLFNVGYAYIDGSIATSDLSGFLLNSILKIALFMTIIDGPNIFESAFGVDAGLKSATRAIIGANQGVQLMKSLGSGASGLTKFAGRKVASGAGFLAGGLSNLTGSAVQSEAMNGIGAAETAAERTSESNSKTAGSGEKGEKGDAGFNGQDGKDGQNGENGDGGENGSNSEQTKTQSENPEMPSIFEQAQARKDFEEQKEAPTKGMTSPAALMDNQEKMAEAFSNLTLPNDLMKKSQTMQDKLSNYRRNMENSVDKIKGIKQNDRSQVKNNLGDLMTPQPKTLKNSFTRGQAVGDSLMKVTGNSSDRRAAKLEQREIYDDFFNPKREEDELNGY